MPDAIIYRQNGKDLTLPLSTIHLEKGNACYVTEQLVMDQGTIVDKLPYPKTPDLYATAGFVNCHVHWLMNQGNTSFDELLTEAAEYPERVLERAIEYARAMVKLGITFACDKGPVGNCGIPIYRGMLSAADGGTAMTHTIFAPWTFMAAGSFAEPYGRMIYTSQEMEIGLRELEAVGASVVKFIPETPLQVDKKSYRFVFPLPAFQSARAIARRKNWVFAVHAKGVESLDVCISVEADSIEHGIQASPEQLRRCQEKNIYLGPTLESLLCRLERARKTGRQMDVATYEWEQVCQMVKAAATLNDGRPFTHMLFSSDAGSYATPHASLRELYLMRQMGYSPAAAFEAAIGNGAKCLKQKQRGNLDRQMRADLVLWSKNPLDLSLEEWQHLDQYIAAVILNGKVAYRQ